ncbi:hypothetical protein MBLNU230_g6703t1 [Neophaeotheca triangularis]
MIPSIPDPEDFDVSPTNAFLPTSPPLQSLPDAYYEPWEYVVKNLQGLILSKRLRGVVEDLDILTTDRLQDEGQWRRAYSVLAFIAHAYIWGGDKPKERVPPTISIPFLATCKHLDLPPVATYSGLVLWNWKPIFPEEPMDTLANLDMIDTFTGSLDEKWFYLISVAIEARGAPIIPLMLEAISAARNGNRALVTANLRSFAERLDDLTAILGKMYENCDPHVFYHRLRPYLAGSKNMADAGLPNGVIFDNGGPINKQKYVQYSGGSNAQSSLIQFFDIALSVEHRPTGTKAPSNADQEKPKGPPSGPPSTNFIHDMRTYMPGAHARFLGAVARVANIRSFVQQHRWDRELSLSFDACLAMLSAFRDKHIQIVSRYIIVKSQQAKKAAATEEKKEGKKVEKINLASRPKGKDGGDGKKEGLKGTGGTSLIPFLRQARDETGEPAVDAWARRLMLKLPSGSGVEALAPAEEKEQGLAGVWGAEDSQGGLCRY